MTATTAVFVHLHDILDMGKVEFGRLLSSGSFALRFADDVTVFFPDVEALRDLQFKLNLLVANLEREAAEAGGDDAGE